MSIMQFIDSCYFMPRHQSQDSYNDDWGKASQAFQEFLNSDDETLLVFEGEINGIGLNGRVYGHPKLYNGDRIMTSPVREIDVAGYASSTWLPSNGEVTNPDPKKRVFAALTESGNTYYFFARWDQVHHDDDVA